MKVGATTVPLQDMPLNEALKYLKNIGVEAVEVSCGVLGGNAHCNPKELLADKQKLKEFAKTFEDNDIELNALNCHGNPIHPIKGIASKVQEEFEDTCHLAQELGVGKVITFSGCAGDCPDSKYPNWVTYLWPEDFLRILDYQWNDCLLPYWEKAGKTAKECGVKVALELHPGFQVYNTASMLRLRRELGDTFGACLAPAHLIWQGNDIVASIRELQGVTYHFQAKDTKVDAINTARKGVLDATPHGEEINRSWIFRTAGCGNGQDFWKSAISALRMTGYDDIISAAQEDSLMSAEEGLKKAVALVREVIISDKTSAM